MQESRHTVVPEGDGCGASCRTPTVSITSLTLTQETKGVKTQLNTVYGSHSPIIPVQCDLQSAHLRGRVVWAVAWRKTGHSHLKCTCLIRKNRVLN